MFHYTNNTIPENIYYKGKEIGLPQAASITVLGLASRNRAALQTVNNWKELYEEYQQVKSEHGSIAMLDGSGFDSHTWPSTPIVQHMQEAAAGYDNKYGDFQAQARELRETHKKIGFQVSVSRNFLPLVVSSCISVFFLINTF